VHRTSRAIDANYARSRVRPGDVLVSIKGTIGRIGLVPAHYEGNISRDLARVRPAAGVASRFLLYLLRSPTGQRTLELARVGTTRAELSIAPLKRLRFAIPRTPAEQENIAFVIDRLEAMLDACIAETSKLTHLKSGLMSDLLSGHVLVPESLSSTEACQ
jgi:type I restriction enzyme S subunit